MRAEAERQRQIEEWQIEQQRLVGQLKALQVEKRTEPSQIVQINQIMERWKDEDADALNMKDSKIEIVIGTYMWIGIYKKTF